MEFRQPEALKMNLFRLLPVYLLVAAVLFFAYATYQYLSGSEEDLLWVAVGGLATVYFTVRSWFAMRWVFVWGDEAEEVDDGDVD